MYSRHFLMSSSYLLRTVLYSKLNRIPSNLDYPCSQLGIHKNNNCDKVRNMGQTKQVKVKVKSKYRSIWFQHDCAEPVEEEGNGDGGKDSVPAKGGKN